MCFSFPEFLNFKHFLGQKRFSGTTKIQTFLANHSGSDRDDGRGHNLSANMEPEKWSSTSQVPC